MERITSKTDLEMLVISVSDRVRRGHPIEDNRLELKAAWPEDLRRCARQIAAHANSALGAEIIWLIGIDEIQGVVGAAQEEFSNWWSGIVGHFDDAVAPTVHALAVPVDGVTVFALRFETDRAPFVIRVGKPGQVTHEVPWRESNSTHSARRVDLLRLLSPQRRQPTFELLEAEATIARGEARHDSDRYRTSLRLECYVYTNDAADLIIPFHRCAINLALAQPHEPLDLEHIRINPPVKAAFFAAESNDSATVSSTQHEVIIRNAGRVVVSAEAAIRHLPDELPTTVAFSFKAHLIDRGFPTTLTGALRLSDRKEGALARWEYRD